MGTLNALHRLRKVINHFNNYNSTISIGVIDLKKAFDKYNIFAMLYMLQSRKINGSIINILENWFLKNQTMVKWGHSISEAVPLLSGVKQGGIMSPLLFNLFVDNVLHKLEESNLDVS